MSFSKIICLDFDGVLHSYESGWKGPAVVFDGPVPGAMEFIHKLLSDSRFEVSIHSSRSNQREGVEAMKSWLHVHLSKYLEERGVDNHWAEALHIISHQISWPRNKPPAFLTIDDRGLTFTGIWPDLDTIAAFKPWNKV